MVHFRSWANSYTVYLEHTILFCKHSALKLLPKVLHSYKKKKDRKYEQKYEGSSNGKARQEESVEKK